MDKSDETVRSKRNAKKLPDPDFVYTEQTKPSPNSRKSKSKQKEEMKANPEKLFYDDSLQKKESGVYIRDHCNAKFFTTRLEMWKDASLKYHRSLWQETKSIEEPVLTNIPGGYQLRIGKTVRGRSDETLNVAVISFYVKNSIVLINGSGFISWIRNHFPNVKALVNDVHTQTSQCKEDCKPKGVTNKKHSTLLSSPAHDKACNMTTLSNEELSYNLDVYSRDSSLICNENTSYELAHSTNTYQDSGEEFETIDEIECSIYQNPQTAVQKLKDYESMALKLKQVQRERDDLHKENKELIVKIGHITSQNVKLQQEVMHKNTYIRHLNNEFDSLSASMDSLHMMNFETPLKAAKSIERKTYQSGNFFSPNKFDILRNFHGNAESLPRKNTSTPTRASPKKSSPVKTQNARPHPTKQKAPNLDSFLEFPALPTPERKQNEGKSVKAKQPHGMNQMSKTKDSTTPKCVPQKTEIREQSGPGYPNTVNKSVMIIGDSIVRGSSSHFKSIAPSKYDATTYTHPGAKVERITKRLTNHKNYIMPDPNYIVLHVGTNNIVQDEVAETIFKLHELITDSCDIFPFSRIIVSSIIPRSDNPEVNEKINSVNVFLKHICSKSKQLIYTENNNCGQLVGRDGLHLTERGKSLLAKNWLRSIRESENFHKTLTLNKP